MKGIILAGGAGTRLYPATIPIVKQLLPIYNKPMIYYPLSVLIMAGVREILIISTPLDLPRFEKLFGDGSQLGLNICYKIQEEPKGLAEAFIIGEDFIGGDSVWMILGDNLFFGNNLGKLLLSVSNRKEGATVFGYHVTNPERYGVVEFDKDNKAISIEEKPKKPKSNYAVTGLYFYDSDVSKIAKSLVPSTRGELEITDLNMAYLKKGKLSIEKLDKGFAWLDTGTFNSLASASNFVQVLEERTGLKIACIEEMVYRLGCIDLQQLKELTKPLEKSTYGQYLLSIINEPCLLNSLN